MGTEYPLKPIANILELLQSLREGQLEAFRYFWPRRPLPTALTRSRRWDVGRLIPIGVFGPSGSLTSFQKKIKSISLITHECTNCRAGGTRVSFTDFEALENLSWEGIHHSNDFLSLKDSLAQSSEQLTNLHLDAFRFDSLWFNDADENIFTNSLPDKQLVRLTRLSLGALPLASPERVIESLNIRHLQSLKLRSCPKWNLFLSTLYDSNQNVNLKTFQLRVHAEVFPDLGPEYIISNFLKSFTGLEELGLSVPGPFDHPLLLWEAAVYHSSTLRRMVYQVRKPSLRRRRRFNEPEHDMNDMSISEESEWQRLEDLVGVLDLECLGLACLPDRLVSSILHLYS